MRRCTSCFRFHPGAPTFCGQCGRSFDLRICVRGHHNPRNATFCVECGSPDLSTAAPPASLLFFLTGLAMYLSFGVVISLVLTSAVVGILYTVNWSALSGPLVALILMLGVLYWTTTIVPGPVKRVGRAAGRGIIWAIRGRRRDR